MMYDYFPFHPLGLFGPVFGILALIFIVFLILSLVRKEGGEGESGDQKALEILKERYARGEIDKKEFEEKRRDLTI